MRKGTTRSLIESGKTQWRRALLGPAEHQRLATLCPWKRPLWSFWFIVKNIYLVFISIPVTEFLKPLEFPTWRQPKDILCYANVVDFRKPLPKHGLPRKPVIKGLEFSVKTVSPNQEGEMKVWRLSSFISSQWLNQLCLCNKASIEKRWLLRTSELMSMWRFWESGMFRQHGSSEPLLHTILYISLPSGYSWVRYPVIITGDLVSKVSLSFVSHSKKLTEYK